MSYGNFNIWPTFRPRDLLIWPLTLKHKNLLYWVKIHLWVKNSGNVSYCSLSMRENVLISFKHEYWRPTLTSRCDVINDVINIKINFSGIISDGLSISDAKINLSRIFRNFQNGRHFEVQAIFQTGSCTEFGVLHQDRPCLSLHFELLFDVLAQKFTELWRFLNLTYFLTSWPNYLTFDLNNKWVSPHYQDTHLGQDWWWLLEWCGLYPANNLHPDRQTNRQTVRRTYLPKLKNVGK